MNERRRVESGDVLTALLQALVSIAPDRPALNGRTPVGDVSDDSLALLEAMVIVEDVLGIPIGEAAIKDVWFALSTHDDARLGDVATALSTVLNRTPA